MRNDIFLFWVRNARYMALPQSLLPAGVAICLAATSTELSADFSGSLAVFAIIGVAFGHLGINLWDDYFDYRKDNQSIRNRLNSSGIRARIAKCDYLKSGEANMKQLFVAASVFSAIALLMGAIIFFKRGEIILIISAITALMGIGYSGSPFKFSYRGLGEVIIGLVFGPLLMAGVYFSACNTLSPELLFVSIPIGLLVTNVVYTHSVIDYEADKAMNKKTLAVLLVKKSRMNFVSFLIIFLPFLIIGAGIIFKILSVWYAFVFLVLFMAIYLFRIILRFQKGLQEKIQPKWWMGNMENWKKIEAAGIEWFMIRWYLARNLLTFFCLIIIIISFL